MALRNTYLAPLDTTFIAKGVRDKIRGGALATQSTRDAALFTQMQCVPTGRRPVARVGLQGASTNLVISGANPANAAQVYPTALSSAERTMLRTTVRLTPGYRLDAVVLFLPSGPTQQASAPTWVEGKPGGSIYITVSVANGVDPPESATTIFNLPTSDLQYKALPAQAGGCWGVVNMLAKSVTPSVLTGTSPGWEEHVDATITITARGGARPLDVIVYEMPERTIHDETHRECTNSLFPTKGADSEYPITAVSQPTNPTRGSQQANKSMGDFRQVYGPTIMQWSCWNEGTATVLQTEGAPVSITTSVGFRSLQAAPVITYGSTNHGWSVSSGAYGRNLEQSGLLELRDVNGAIPVTVRAYARMTNAAHTGTIRFQTADYALRDLTITGSSSFGWYKGLAWIRTPIHASLDSLLQVSAKVALVAQTLEIRYLSVEFGGHYTVTE